MYEEFLDAFPVIPRSGIVRTYLVEDGNLITAHGGAFREFAAAVGRRVGLDCPDTVFSPMAGEEYAEEDFVFHFPPVVVFAGYWAAVCLQIMAYLLLYGILECRFRPFTAFIAVLLFNLAFISPHRHSIWDWASLSHGCWAKPFGVAVLLAGWLTFIAILYLLGHAVYRKADVL